MIYFLYSIFYLIIKIKIKIKIINCDNLYDVYYINTQRKSTHCFVKITLPH